MGMCVPMSCRVFEVCLRLGGPEPLSPIAESVFKQYLKEWAASKSDERSGTTQEMAQKPNLLDESKEKFLPT